MAPRKVRRGLPNNTETAPQLAQLPPKDEQPPKLLIFPQNVSSEARFYSLPNPSNAQLCRYLYCPQTGFYELTTIGAKDPHQQSCLLVPEASESEGEAVAEEREENEALDPESSYVLERAQFLIATPLDAALLLMPLFEPANLSNESRPRMARTAEHLLDDLAAISEHMGLLLRYPSVRKLFESRLECVCDTMPAIEEVAYKPNPRMMMELLLTKATAVAEIAFPESLEDHVQKQLEPPAVVVAMRESENQNQAVEGEAQSLSDLPPAIEKECGIAIETSQTKNHEQDWAASDKVIKQMRLKTAIEFVFSSYVRPQLKSYFNDLIASGDMVDLREVSAHLDKIEKLKAEALALRSLSSNIRRKRSAEVEDEAQERNAEKKRKKDEDEKKRKQETRAMKDLKKADTTGMKKLNSFFTKKTPAPAS